MAACELLLWHRHVSPTAAQRPLLKLRGQVSWGCLGEAAGHKPRDAHTWGNLATRNAFDLLLTVVAAVLGMDVVCVGNEAFRRM